MTGTTFGKRFGAYLIDALILWAIMLIPFIVYFMVLSKASDDGNLGGVFAAWLVMMMLILGLSGWYWSTKGTERGSWGQRRMRIRLVNVDTGRPIGRGASIGRAAVLSIVPFAPLSVFFDSSGRYRGWHDRAVRSVVVDVATTAAHLRADQDGASDIASTPEPARVTPVTMSAIGHGAATATTTQDERPVESPADDASAPRHIITSVPGMEAKAPASPMPDPAPPAELEEDEDVDATRLTPSASRARKTALVWDDGVRHLLAGATTFGRNPVSVTGATAVTVADDTRSLSKTHFTVAVNGNAITVTDEGSTNGTDVVRAEGSRIAVVPGTPVPVAPGDALAMGDRTCAIEVSS